MASAPGLRNSTVRGMPRGRTPRALAYRKLQFDRLEDRTLLSVTIKGLPIDLGTVSGFTQIVPLDVSDSGRVMGELRQSMQSKAAHAFVYDYGRGIRDIGTLGSNRPNTSAADISASGQVVGWCNDPSDWHAGQRAFLYDGTTLVDIGDLGGGDASAQAIKNGGGMVVGYSLTSDFRTHAFLYDGTMRDLGGMDNIYRPYTIATDINEHNQIVGYGFGLEEPNHAFLYNAFDATPMQDLGTLPGFVESRAEGISDSGTVYGTLKTAGGVERPFAYYGGQMHNIGTLGGSQSRATAMNNRGVVVGTSTTAAGREHAFVYSDGRIRDLGALGASSSWANDINDAGQVVGGSYAAGHPRMHAFVYDGGQMIDLSNLLPASAGWELNTAFAINNRGQVVGTGFHNGKARAFLLTLGPVDKRGPTTSNVKVAPSPANVAPKVTAKIDDTRSGGSKIVAAECFIDQKGASGKAIRLGGTFDSATETVAATLPAAAFRALKQGRHTIYVHGKDVAGNWGGFVAAGFVKDTVGPVASQVRVVPALASAAPRVSAKIDDLSTGGSRIVAAEYFIDRKGASGKGTPLGAEFNSATQTVTATLLAESFAALAPGKHTVYVHGEDAAGNWSQWRSVSFTKTALPKAAAMASASVRTTADKKSPSPFEENNDAAIAGLFQDWLTQRREDSGARLQ